MHLLLGWDDTAQADLIGLYLSAGGHQVTAAHTAAEFRDRLADGPFDVVLLSTRLAPEEGAEPTADAAFAAFTQTVTTWPETPVIGGCPQAEVYRVARFLTNGMRTYVVRDDNGDFVFLIESILEGVIDGVKAEQDRLLVRRLREEVDSVRKVQESIIPRDLQSLPGYRIAGRYEPSQIRIIGGKPVALAGGDLYDVFRLDDNRLVVLLGDASGHGMKACLSIMTMHTLIRMLRDETYNDTAGFVAEINRRLCDQAIVNDDGGFITLLFGILRSDTGEFTWTSAGHPAPLLQCRGDGELRPLGGVEDGGLPLGIFDGADYDSHTHRLTPGSRLLLYTDGLEEAFPAGGEHTPHSAFGVAGIIDSLRRTGSLAADDALTALFADSETFTAGAGRHDDTSALLIDHDGAD